MCELSHFGVIVKYCCELIKYRIQRTAWITTTPWAVVAAWGMKMDPVAGTPDKKTSPTRGGVTKQTTKRHLRCVRQSVINFTIYLINVGINFPLIVLSEVNITRLILYLTLIYIFILRDLMILSSTGKN